MYGSHRTYKRRLQRKRQKEKEKMAYGTGYEAMIVMNSLSKLAGMPCQVTTKSEPVQEKVANMYVDYVSSDKHSESAKTNYLLSRYENTKSEIRSDLRKQFGLDNDDRPTTAKELADRILSGKYVLPTEKEEELMRERYCFDWSVLDGIKWRDPAIKEDKDGFKLAETELNDESMKVHDAVMIKDHDTALTAIQAFKDWKPTGVAPAQA